MQSLNHCKLLHVGRFLLPLSLVKLVKIGKKQTNKQTKSFSGPVSLSCCGPGKRLAGVFQTQIHGCWEEPWRTRDIYLVSQQVHRHQELLGNINPAAIVSVAVAAGLPVAEANSRPAGSLLSAS